MPSRASTSLLRDTCRRNATYIHVSMPSRASTSLLRDNKAYSSVHHFTVSMPSRASTSLLRLACQEETTFISMCQCPHGLVPHCYQMNPMKKRAVLQRVSMPSRASTSLLQPFEIDGMESWCEVVSMPSRASTSLLQYPFKNLGFMRFPEPVFAGICQNILTVTVFRAC